jgi:hypothetical protein
LPVLTAFRLSRPALCDSFAAVKPPAKDRTALWVSLALAFLTVAVYWPVRENDFLIYDDADYIYENARVLDGLSLAGVLWAFTTNHSANWHPLTWLSHMLDVQLFGRGPGPMHLVNVLFHTANSVLLFLLLRRLTKALWPSAFVAALSELPPKQAGLTTLHANEVADCLQACRKRLPQPTVGQNATARDVYLPLSNCQQCYPSGRGMG